MRGLSSSTELVSNSLILVKRTLNFLPCGPGTCTRMPDISPRGGTNQTTPRFVLAGFAFHKQAVTPFLTPRFWPCPGGASDNSPALQRWVGHAKMHKVPEGRLNQPTARLLPLRKAQEALEAQVHPLGSRRRRHVSWFISRPFADQFRFPPIRAFPRFSPLPPLTARTPFLRVPNRY
jgi:hypothetical protein